MSRTLVVLPTFNERATIDEVLERLFESSDVDVLVVDDASPDGTAAAVRERAAGDARVHLLERAEKMGLASAYVAGFTWALGRDYGAIVEMDADLSHDPAGVAGLVSALAGADLAIGSRYVAGGRIEDWGPLRRAVSAAGNLYARIVLGLGVRDSTSGFRAFRRATLAAQDLTTIRADGYAFQIEMAYRVARSGGRIVEVPIVFTDRTRGRSKMTTRIAIEAFVRVTRWGVRRVLARRRSLP